MMHLRRWPAPREVLLGDTLTTAGRLEPAGVAVSTEIVPGTVHAWPSVLPDTPAADVALARIVEFVSRR